MIVCTGCGTENTESQVTCTSCGSSLEEAAARKLIGTVVLGVYEITDFLGMGGMSVVYKARHRMTDQAVALKILPPELAVHTALKARFVEEAKALAKMEHPAIVHLYNFGEEAGRFVLAMQYVEGKTFERLIFDAGKLPWPEAVLIVNEVLRALDFAHGRGVIHRDIKPSNVMVRADGTATVMDFGIAKIQEASGRLTAQGQTMGTVRYMSPEQVRGDKVDARSDLYSLGAALYEAITGETPFDGNTHFEIMSKHLAMPPQSPRARGVAIPEALDAALLKGLAKAPAERFQTAREMLQTLERILKSAGEPSTLSDSRRRISGIASTIEPAVQEETGLTRPAPAQRRTGLWIGLAILVIGASAGVLVFAARQKPTPPPPVAWVDPLLVPGLTPTVDERFDADLVRVVAAGPVDAAKLARAYADGRERFAAWVKAKGLAPAIDVTPVTLVVADARTMCAAEFHPEAPPPGCEAKAVPYHYTGTKTRTLYLHDTGALDEAVLGEGSAAQVCSEQLVLLELGCLKKRQIVREYLTDLSKGAAPK